ncbi:MAG: AI-2E family transporter [Pirellulales bacterium]|nr:AI-2E family transporter [Pirellulales bacterium]
MARLVSFVVLAAIIVLFAILFFQVMAQFLLPMFLAVILVVMFRPVHQWFIIKCGGRVRTAALLTTLAILMIVLAPMLTILAFAIGDATSVVTAFNPDVLLAKVTRLRENLGLDLGLPIVEVRKLPEIEAKLNELETAAVATTVDQQRAALAKFAPLPEQGKDAPSLFKDLQGLSVSLTAKQFMRPGETDPNEAANQRYQQARADVREMLTLNRRLWDQVSVPDMDSDAPAPGFEATVNELSAAYYEFKRATVGGPLLENVRLWANPSREDLAEARQSVTGWVQSYAVATGTVLGGWLANLAIGLLVLVISLYYFLADGPGMIATIMRLLPLDDRYERQLLTEFDRISRAVVLATILSAVVQGILAGIGFTVAGFDAIFLLTVVTMLLALVPFVGAAAVWGSCAVWLLIYEERIFAASMLALYGVFVISMADNVIKPIVLHGQSKLHPLLALLSVLGGVRALGPIGIFVGPMAVAFLQALLNILNTELTALSQRVPTLHAPE